MKFSCTKENLLTGLQSIVSVASKAVHLPILHNVLIEATEAGIVLTATDLEMVARARVRGKVETPGSFTVPAQVFTNTVQLMQSDRVDVVLDGTALQLSAGDQHTKIQGEVVENFPLIPDFKSSQEISVSLAAFQQGLKQVLIATAHDDSRPEFTAVLASMQKEQLVLAATDTYRLAEKKLTMITVRSAKIHVLIQPRSLQEIVRLTSADEQADILIGENQLAVRTTGIELYSRLIEGDFPDYQSVLPSGYRTTVIFQRTELVQAIKAASVFSRSGIFDVNLHIDADAKKVTITAVNHQLGEQTSKIDAQIDGDSNNIVFNYKFMLDAVSQLNTDQITMQLVDNQAPARFQPVLPGGEVDYFHVVVPIKP